MPEGLGRERSEIGGDPPEDTHEPLLERDSRSSRNGAPAGRVFAGIVDAGADAEGDSGVREQADDGRSAPEPGADAGVVRLDADDVDEGSRPDTTSEGEGPLEQPVYVLGRQVDTAVAANWTDHRILDLPDWTPAKNEAWIREAIDQRADVYVGSNQTYENMWDPVRGAPRMFAVELQWLDEAGYHYDLRDDGVYLVPPAREVRDRDGSQEA